MLRVLLVIDDFNENAYFLSFLRKLGFDVESISSQAKYQEASLGFNPQIVLASDSGRKVNGIELAKSIVRRGGFPKFIVLSRVKYDPVESVDFFIDSPVNIHDLLAVLSESGGLNLEDLLAKFEKIKGLAKQNNENESATRSQGDGEWKPKDDLELQIIKGNKEKRDATQSLSHGASDLEKNHKQGEDEKKSILQASELSDEERSLKFEKFIVMEAIDSKEHLSAKRIKAYNKKIRLDKDNNKNDELEAERRAFVKKLIDS